MDKVKTGETDVPAKPSKAEAYPRLPEAQQPPWRHQGAEAPAPQGPQAPDGVDGSKMTSLAARFPKEARLRRSRDFRFRPVQVVETSLFRFLYSSRGEGRLGISLSKRSLRHATARNRVRRLLREAFRKRRAEASGLDVNVVARGSLETSWRSLVESDVARELDRFLVRCHRLSSRRPEGQ